MDQVVGSVTATHTTCPKSSEHGILTRKGKKVAN